MNRTAITIIAAILSCSAAAAQGPLHEFSVNIGGGMSGLQTQPTIGKDHWKGTTTVGLGYHYLFNPHWAVGTGANFTVYKGDISIENYDRRQAAIRKETVHAFDFLVSSSAYTETQQAMMITIPLMAQYQYQFQDGGKTAFYAALGAKVGIPVSAKSRSKGVFTTKGYYTNPDMGVTYDDDYPDYGFVMNQPFPEGKTRIGLKAAVMATAECGVIWRLVKETSLYTGFYVDCGLNNTLNRKTAANANLVMYQSESPAQFLYNTAVNSYAKRMKPFAAGITLRFAFQTW